MTQIRAIVHGRVQGVCFRAETVATGRRLGLTGYARNLTDGTVEVIAAGNQAALKSLVDFLHEGPTLADVTRVDIDWEDGTPVADRFDIRP
jgi:acylphosphatase